MIQIVYARVVYFYFLCPYPMTIPTLKRIQCDKGKIYIYLSNTSHTYLT